ncbi:hypothetical protein TcBrA4_0100960 [Trypanosoma cruzi]|nr:hypothetical protein TcBrA4_0100960 [Trypanosoma cruzi]
MKLSEESFARVRKIAKEFLDTREHLFVVDCFAGHDERYRLKVRVFTTRPYHALFMRDMLILPTPEELATLASRTTSSTTLVSARRTRRFPA